MFFSFLLTPFFFLCGCDHTPLSLVETKNTATLSFCILLRGLTAKNRNKKHILSHTRGAPPIVASGSRSTVYRLDFKYMMGTPGTLRRRRRRSLSQVATM